jgi:phenylacetate-CoA ligase
MIGTPSMVTHLGEVAEEVIGEPAAALSVRKIIVGGEPGGGVPAIRGRMEELWGADVRDMMGGADFGCTYWGECDEKDGMHLCSQGCLHVEIVDPITLEPLPIEAGVTGELVYTAIARRATPLLRYRMGDIITVNATSCSCGRTGYKIKAHGRADDMLIVRGINVFPAAVKDVVMQFIPQTTGILRILVDFEGHSTFQPLQVRVEHAHEVPGDQLQALKSALENRIRNVLTVSAVVTLVPEGSLERPGVQKEKLIERVPSAQ